MNKSTDTVTLAHGSGGVLTHNLIKNIFYKHFSNDILALGHDSAILNLSSQKLAFTTDSFVINPIFFAGGDIGKLAICGTVNDLLASGATPLYLSCGFIIEDGFSIEQLEAIVKSMSMAAKEAEIAIVTGDTKVVQKGACDKLYINTSGIGAIPEDIYISPKNAKSGDVIIVTGTLGDHGCSILLERDNMGISANIQSDCAPLNTLMEKAFNVSKSIHVLRDPTRGGIASTLNEIATDSNVGIIIYENQIPIRKDVAAVCDMLGLDPLYMANEGKMVIIVPAQEADKVVNALRQEKHGKHSAIIGEVVSEHPKKVICQTITGGGRIVDMLQGGDILPRIC